MWMRRGWFVDVDLDSTDDEAFFDHDGLMRLRAVAYKDMTGHIISISSGHFHSFDTCHSAIAYTGHRRCRRQPPWPPHYPSSSSPSLHSLPCLQPTPGISVLHHSNVLTSQYLYRAQEASLLIEF